jgi:hypothetical protein
MHDLDRLLRCRILSQDRNIFKNLENYVDILEYGFIIPRTMNTTNLHLSPCFRLAGADNYPSRKEAGAMP